MLPFNAVYEIWTKFCGGHCRLAMKQREGERRKYEIQSNCQIFREFYAFGLWRFMLWLEAKAFNELSIIY